MSLSSEWSRAIVVRNEGNHDIIVQPTMTDNNNSAKVYAAAGNPIILRKRDPAIFTAVRSDYDISANSALNNNNNSSNNSYHYNNIWSMFVGKQVSQTFWIPDSSKHEMGLLEALHRRGPQNKTHMLLQSRPLAELQYNYSTCTGLNIDLSHNAFRLSKTAMALQHVNETLNESEQEARFCNNDYTYNKNDINFAEKDGNNFVDKNNNNNNNNSNDNNDNNYIGNNRHGGNNKRNRRHNHKNGASSNIVMPTSQFKSTLRASLQSIQEEDYYLVKYRDYSEWAVQTYSNLAKSDSLFDWRKYVEQCFVVHVGREPGELIPITEAQFLFGVDILQRQLLNQLTTPNQTTNTLRNSLALTMNVNERNYKQFELDINYSALNADQFRSLWIMLGDGFREVGVEGEEVRRKEESKAARRKETEKEIQMRLMEERERIASQACNGFYDPYYVAPAWYDWSPAAIKKRIKHRLSRYYVSVGRLVLQLTVLSVAGYICYSVLYPYIPSIPFKHNYINTNNNNNNNNNIQKYYDNNAPPPSKRRLNRRTSNVNNQNDYYDSFYENDIDVAFTPRPGLLRSVFMGPKAVFDYMLAPEKV